MKRILLLPLLLWAAGCAPDTAGTGRMLFADKCAVCHGATGRGDGELAAQLDKRPADLTKIAARRDGIWPMLEVMSIVDGYSNRYLPGSEMPIYPDFTEGRLVAIDTGNGIMRKTPERLLAITLYLETLQDPKPVRTVP